MTQSLYLNGGNSQAQDKLAEAYLFAPASEGIAKTGVISGLGVTQTPSASGSVIVGAGAGVVQASRTAGADRPINDTDYTLDVFTANPMGSLARNDIVVFDPAALTQSTGTGGIRVIVGTANASPTDPTIPATVLPLARLRNAASATTIPTANIDDLRTFTTLRGVPAPVSDTGWLAITLNSGSFAAVSGYPWQYRQKGDDVWITGQVSWAGGSLTDVMGTLPVAARPTNGNRPLCLSLGSGTNCVMEILVGADGTIRVPFASSYSGTPVLGMNIKAAGSYLAD